MTSISTMGRALANIEQLKKLQFQYTSLTTQLNTGRKTQKFSGLGADVISTQRARINVNQIESFQNNISNTKNRIGLMLNAIEEFQAQSQIFEDLVFGLSQESLHQKGNQVFSPVEVTGAVDLTAFGGANSITTLIAAATPNLDPPNDQFTITLEDTVGAVPRAELVLDISDAEAAAGAGNAQIELLNYINAQITAQLGTNDFEVAAVADVGGGITISGRGNITIDGSAANGMGAAGLAALGFTEGTTPVTDANILGYDSNELDTELTTLKRLAGKVHDFLIDLLNAQEGDRYLLGGAETGTPPISNNGILATSVDVLINNWKTSASTPATATSALIADLTDRDPVGDGNPDALSDSIIGYNSSLSAGTVGNVTVRVNERSEIDYTVLANEGPFRDLLVATAVFKSDSLYPLSDVYDSSNTLIENGAPGASVKEQEDNFFTLLSAVRTMTNDALEDINDSRFQLENTRARLVEIETQNRLAIESLDNFVSGKEIVDVNEVAVQINSLQISLEASYSVTARSQQLSLINFLR